MKSATHNADMARMQIIERAVADNLRDYIVAYRAAAPHIGAELMEVGRGVAAFVGLGSPITSVKGLGPALTVADLQAIERFYARHRVERVVIETAPWLEGESRDLLLASGYTEAGHEDVMARWRDDAPGEPVREVEIVPVTDWPGLMGDAYEMDDSPSGRELCLTTAAMPNAELFGIRVQGKWAACAQTNPYTQSAILGCDGTLPEFRGRGLQTALIQHRVALLPAGTLAIAEVAPGSTSQRSYLRCGFELAYSRTHFIKSLH